MENKGWLDEKTLGDELRLIFKKDFIHNKQIPNSGLKYRPDYRNEDLKLIVEFDGPRHYTEGKTVYLDKKKDELYRNLGYSIVRVPYFTQLTTDTIKELFKIDYLKDQTYPHGFNEKNVILPTDFCTSGVHRFMDDLYTTPSIYFDVEKTIQQKIKELGDVEMVLPEPLFFLWSTEYFFSVACNQADVILRLLLKDFTKNPSKKVYEERLKSFLESAFIENNKGKLFPEVEEGFKKLKINSEVPFSETVEKGIKNFEELKGSLTFSPLLF